MLDKKKGGMAVINAQGYAHYSNIPKPDPHIPKRKSENDSLAYAIMVVATLLLSLTAPLLLSGSTYTMPVAWVSCATCAVLVILTSKNFFTIFQIALIYMFAISYLGDPVSLAIVMGTVLASGLYSAAVAAADRSHIFFLVIAPLLPIAVIYLITGELTVSVLSALHFLPALAMGLGARRSMPKTYTVALYAAVLVLIATALSLTHIYLQNGALTFNVIDDSAEYLRGGISAFMNSALKNADLSSLEGALVLQPRRIAILAVNLLPAIITVIALVSGFFAQRVEQSLFNIYGKDKLLESAKEPISVSCTAALVFLVAHLLSFTTSASNTTSFVGIVSLNVSIILLPALLCIGARALIVKLPKKIGILAIAAWIAIFLISNSVQTSIITILALIGAFYIILVRVEAWAKDHYAKKGEGQ